MSAPTKKQLEEVREALKALDEPCIVTFPNHYVKTVHSLLATALEGCDQQDREAREARREALLAACNAENIYPDPVEAHLRIARLDRARAALLAFEEEQPT